MRQDSMSHSISSLHMSDPQEICESNRQLVCRIYIRWLCLMLRACNCVLHKDPFFLFSVTGATCIHSIECVHLSTQYTEVQIK